VLGVVVVVVSDSITAVVEVVVDELLNEFVVLVYCVSSACTD